MTAPVWRSDDEATSRPVVATHVRWHRSLRWRTAVSATLLAAVLLGATGLVLTEVTLTGAHDQLRGQAVAQLRTAAATAAFGGAPPAQAVTRAESLPRPLARALQSGTGTGDDGVATYDDGRRMWAARTTNSGVLATWIDNDELREQRRRLATALVLSLLVGAAVAGVFSWWIAGRLTARLRESAARVNDVIAGGRGPTAAAPDEVGVMNHALQTTAAALSERLRREEEFTADVAHDLRTPLTALVSSVDRLPDSERAEVVRRQVLRLRRLVDDLLSLARADAPHVGGTTRLSAVVGSATEAFRDADLVTVTVRDDRDVEVDPARLEVVLRNLVANALRHGAAPVTVVVDATTVRVEDHGPGFPVALLADGPRRSGRSSQTSRTGLGLAIATRHCRAMGVDLVLSNRTVGGAAATLRV